MANLSDISGLVQKALEDLRSNEVENINEALKQGRDILTKIDEEIASAKGTQEAEYKAKKDALTSAYNQAIQDALNDLSAEIFYGTDFEGHTAIGSVTFGTVYKSLLDNDGDINASFSSQATKNFSDFLAVKNNLGTEAPVKEEEGNLLLGDHQGKVAEHNAAKASKTKAEAAKGEFEASCNAEIAKIDDEIATLGGTIAENKEKVNKAGDDFNNGDITVIEYRKILAECNPIISGSEADLEYATSEKTRVEAKKVQGIKDYDNLIGILSTNMTSIKGEGDATVGAANKIVESLEADKTAMTEEIAKLQKQLEEVVTEINNQLTEAFLEGEAHKKADFEAAKDAAAEAWENNPNADIDEIIQAAAAKGKEFFAFQSPVRDEVAKQTAIRVRFEAEISHSNTALESIEDALKAAKSVVEEMEAHNWGGDVA